MSYKIAVASTDGKVVNQHFGRAEKFYILEVNDDNEFYYMEERENIAACNGGTHSDEGLNLTVQLLIDCKYVLVSQIGPVAEHALSKKGVTAFAISHFIEEAVNKLIYFNSEIKINKLS
jgi:predicted Fe-Mo cluster-binding NifX family protein